MARRWESLFLVAGMALAAYAVWGIMHAPDSGQATAATLPPVPTTVTAPAEPATEVIEVVEVPPPPPGVDEVSSAISNVLAENGHTELVSRSDLLDSLPASVVAVLIDNEAVLEVADVPTEVRP